METDSNVNLITIIITIIKQIDSCVFKQFRNFLVHRFHIKFPLEIQCFDRKEIVQYVERPDNLVGDQEDKG